MYEIMVQKYRCSFLKKSFPDGLFLPRTGQIRIKIRNIMAGKYVNAFISFILSAVVVIVIMGCKDKKAEGTEVRGAGKPVTKEKILNVKAQPVEKETLRPFIKTNGSLKAFDEVTVSSEVDGILKSVAVEEGSVVTKGMLLGSVSENDYKLQVQQARALLKQATATFQNASIDYRRKKSLAREELLTNQQLDDAATRLALAEAEVDRAKASLDMAMDRLSKTSVHAPLSGIIKEKKISAGSYVRSATPLFTIIQINPLKLLFSITEKETGRVKHGQEVSFTVDSFPDRNFTGKVDTIYPNLEESTRTLKIDASVSNISSILKPGFFANVIIYTDAPREILLVPVVSILYDDSRTRVFVLDGEIARERPVVTGAQYGDLMEITEGVVEKEFIVTAGNQNLADGVKVHVEPNPSESEKIPVDGKSSEAVKDDTPEKETPEKKETSVNISSTGGRKKHVDR